LLAVLGLCGISKALAFAIASVLVFVVAVAIDDFGFVAHDVSEIVPDLQILRRVRMCLRNAVRAGKVGC
jgi:hypothetical protein